MLEAGDPAPDFTLSGVTSADARYMLSAAAEEGPVVLAFVPPADGRARELLDTLAEVRWGALIDRIAVFGICPSEPVALALAEQNYPFPILLDGRTYVTGLYGVPTGANSEPKRALALADQRCTVRYAWTAIDETDRVPTSELTDAVSSLA